MAAGAIAPARPQVSGQLLVRRPWMVTLLTLLGVLAGWQLLGVAVNSPWIPPVSEVLVRIADLFASGRIVPALLSSITTLIAGFVVSVVIGVLLGAAMAVSTTVEDAFQPFLEIGLMIPHIVFAPIFFAFFGLSDGTLIAVVFIFTIFPVMINSQTAVSATDQRLADMAVSFGASRWDLFRLVVLPEAAPLIFAGLRIGMARAVKGLVVGEVFVTVVGLGAMERQYSSSFDGPGMWAIAVVVIVLAVILTSLVQLVDRRLNGWAYR